MSDEFDGPDGAFQRRTVDIAGAEAGRDWGIAVESPVEIRLNGSAWTMMLATPNHLEDLAVGLALTERVVREAQSIEAIRVTSALGEFTVELTVPAKQLLDPSRRARSLASNSGCGVCGLESLAAFRTRLDDDGFRGPSKIEIPDAAIQAAFAALPAHQTVNRATHSVHAAAWCDLDGRILAAREDVGRHNALDKLVGGRARGQHLGEPGFIVMTSRCSYELVYKAATARALLLATISAPTTLALTWSEILGVPLACVGPGRQIVRFPQESAHAIG